MNFNNVVLEEKDLTLPVVELDMLPKGQYFLKARVKNKSGLTQTAFDYYYGDLGKLYGVKCFYVDAKGNIVEDIYED